jgi:hypothetical protein
MRSPISHGPRHGSYTPWPPCAGAPLGRCTGSAAVHTAAGLRAGAGVAAGEVAAAADASAGD